MFIVRTDWSVQVHTTEVSAQGIHLQKKRQMELDHMFYHPATFFSTSLYKTDYGIRGYVAVGCEIQNGGDVGRDNDQNHSHESVAADNESNPN